MSDLGAIWVRPGGQLTVHPLAAHGRLGPIWGRSGGMETPGHWVLNPGDDHGHNRLEARRETSLEVPSLSG